MANSGFETNDNPLHFNDDDEKYEDIFSEFDIAKLLVVTNKSIFWVIFIFCVAIFAAFLFHRYTKPVYEAKSILKLDSKKEAGVLGFNLKDEGFQQSSKISTLSGEIELIKSQFLYEKVIEKMDMGISYYAYGKVIFEEKYKCSPFHAKVKLFNHEYYDKRFDVVILNNHEFELSYHVGDNEISEVFHFGKNITTSDFEIMLRLNPHVEYMPGAKYFFVVNSTEALIKNLTDNVKVEILNLDASTISISYKDHNSLKAADVVNMIDSVYLHLTMEEKSKSHEQTIRFLEHSLQSTEENLDKAERDLEKFVRSNKTVDVKNDYLKFGDKIESLDLERLNLKNKISLLNELKELIINNDNLNNFIPSISQIEDPQLMHAITSLNQLQLEKERLLASQKENTFVVKAKLKSIETSKTNILSLISINKKLLFEQLNELNRQIYSLESTILSLPAKETELTRLKRFYTIYEKFYLLLMEKQAEFGIAKAGTIPNFVILSPAKPPKAPIYPNTLFLYLSGAGIGLFLGLALIFFRYFLLDTISTQKELEKALNTPILGGVPQYLKEKLDVSKLVVDKSPKSAISEAFRSIRTNLEFISPNTNKRLIAVTSTVSGEGKTFIATNLAGVIAMSDQKVVVLDLDMRKPKVHLAFDKENFKGMSTILIGKHKVAECVQETGLKNLDFISAGPTPPNPSELILRPDFEETLDALFNIYDVVVIDTPPVGLVTDGILILKRVDIPIYVVRANYSKKSVKRNINKLSKIIGGNKLSVVTNALTTLNTFGYGGYGYGYGYGYYEGEDSKDSVFDKIKKRLKKKK
ncbi:MAG: GumC family protein [Cytophagaceae bacterium]